MFSLKSQFIIPSGMQRFTSSIVRCYIINLPSQKEIRLAFNERSNEANSTETLALKYKNYFENLPQLKDVFKKHKMKRLQNPV